MRKVLAQGTKYIFGAFGIAILGLLMSLTYQALQRIFPTSFINTIWGLVLFDIAAICWALAFVFGSGTVTQYALSAIGFLVGFLGTLGMVAAEVILGQDMFVANSQQISQWLVYGFIGATALHAALLYGHHAGAQEIKQRIDVGIARGEITTEAIKQATATLDAERTKLAETIRDEIIANVKRDLNIPILATGTIFDPQTYEQAIPHPVEVPTIKDEAIKPSSPLVKAVNKLTAPFRSQASDAPKNGASANVDAANGSNPPLATEKPQSTPPTASESLEIKTCSYCGRSQEQTFSKFRTSNWLWKYTDEHGTITICDACNQEGTPQRKSYLSA